MLVGMVAIPVEHINFVAGKILADKALLYQPPQIESYTNYMKNRDLILDWPSPASIGKKGGRPFRLTPCAKFP